jgi:hypothetical protein
MFIEEYVFFIGMFNVVRLTDEKAVAKSVCAMTPSEFRNHSLDFCNERYILRVIRVYSLFRTVKLLPSVVQAL